MQFIPRGDLVVIAASLGLYATVSAGTGSELPAEPELIALLALALHQPLTLLGVGAHYTAFVDLPEPLTYIVVANLVAFVAWHSVVKIAMSFWRRGDEPVMRPLARLTASALVLAAATFTVGVMAEPLNMHAERLGHVLPEGAASSEGGER